MVSNKKGLRLKTFFCLYFYISVFQHAVFFPFFENGYLFCR